MVLLVVTLGLVLVGQFWQRVEVLVQLVVLVPVADWHHLALVILSLMVVLVELHQALPLVGVEAEVELEPLLMVVLVPMVIIVALLSLEVLVVQQEEVMEVMAQQYRTLQLVALWEEEEEERHMAVELLTLVLEDK